MPTAFTGSLGWTGAHPILLGGPPLINTYSRPLASKAGPLGAEALPLLAHAYLNDGVTPAATATFGVLNRPSLKATTANGGYDQITLEVAAPVSGLTQGNVIRLTELGGPFAGFVYGGVIESFPDTLSSTGTKHEIVVSPLGWELTRVATQLVYTAPVDVAQMVRDAVALTQHCSCDQVSVPPTTGTLAATNGGLDFRGQKVNQVLDTARSIAGPQWYWYCDELGRVWFQTQGSGAVYTFMGGQHYTERVTNGGDIKDRINRVQVSGSPSASAAPITATYNGASQSSIGIRALEPPIQLAHCSDSSVISAVAANVGATLDQVWTRVQLKALPALGIANERHPGRVHGSQPGGATIRYWEPGVTPLPETGAVAGYTGPFICQSVDYDGLYQQIEAGSIPVTSQTDIDNLVQSLVARGAAVSLNNSPVFTSISSANPIANQIFQVSDPTGQVRLQIGNLAANGISPAQWGFRANDASGNPIFDSLGLIAVMQLPGASFVSTFSIGAGVTSFTLVTGSATTFSVNRNTRILALISAYFSTVGGQPGHMSMFLDGADEGGSATIVATVNSGSTLSGFWSGIVNQGSHTFDLRVLQIAGGTGMTIQSVTLLVFAAGSV